MADFCDDNRFELIEKYKQKLIEETNIESAPDEMKVLNDILFRFWQMGWLDQLEQPTEQQWIPVKARPMTDEERNYWSEHYGYDVEYEDAVMFDCKMPEDKQPVWVQSQCGNVYEDVCENDDGMIGLEGNGDWNDIVAWMPKYVPDPWKGEQNE